MAEVAAKKSINVVSNKKNSEACSVQSNNGLIDLGNITSCSNNQLITLSDDDLLLTNNTKNDINVDDKSLQELIESELALRISSTNDMDNGDEAEYNVIGYIEETEVTRSQPEITKIVLEPRPNPQDVNSEFIIAEMNHYNVIEDRHGNQNGHFPLDIKPKLFDPDTNVSEKVNDRNGTAEPEIDQLVNVEQTINAENSGQANTETIRDICGKETPVSAEIGDFEEGLTRVVPDDKLDHLDNVDGDSSRLIFTMDNVVRDEIEEKISSPKPTSQSAEDSDSRITELPSEFKDSSDIILDTSSKTTELADTWSNTESSGDTLQIGQFSDNFDESLQQIDNYNSMQLGSDADVPVPELKLDLGVLQNQVTDNLEDAEKIIQTCTETPSVSTEDSNILDSQTEPTNDISYELITQQEAVNKTIENGTGIIGDAEVVQEFASPVQAQENKDIENSSNLLAFDISSTRDFIDSERRDVRESSHQVFQKEVETVEESVSQDPTFKDGEVSTILTTESTIIEDSREVRKSTKTFEIIQTTEKITPDESPRVFSDSKYADHCFIETPSQGQDFESWTTVEQATSESCVNETTEEEGVQVISNESNSAITNPSDDWTAVDLQQLAPLATPDDEISDVSNKCDLHIESREEVITTTSVVTSSTTSAKSAKTAKTKKKKIEGVANSDASPGLTPRTKKTKKSKKSDPEKENISVNGNIDESIMRTKISPNHTEEKIEPAGDDELSNVNVKTLTQSYVSETHKGEHEKSSKEIIATGVSIKQLCRSFGDLSNMSDAEVDAFVQEDHHMPDSEEKSSFNKFDALSKKPVLHVRSVDAGKVQQQFNAVGQNGEPNPNCRSCGKVVFQMEQTKAEGLIWHKNCFRCNQCSKQLSVDNYQSHEATLYCKAHFKELFQPKPVEESDQPIRPRKPELIIRENQPTELPPDVVRASDKPDLGLEELSALNVKSRFQVFEKAGMETNDIERSPSQVAVKRSPSILSKLAKFQAKGMDIGVADESLNGIPYEESSESEEEEEETDEVDTEIIKAKRSTRERPMSFSKMDDMKNRWESTSQQGRRESQREARKEEIAGIRSRLFMGKQGKMKEMYQQAVAESERVTKVNASEEIQEIQQTAHARSIKERFERGEPIAANEDENPEDKFKHQDRADEEVIAAGISKKSRSLFLELDATAAKTARPVTPVTPKTPADSTRRARDAFVGRQVSEDVVRSTDTAEEVRAQTSDISNKFKFFEAYKAPEKQRRQFRITPPRDGQVKMESPEREIYRDPEVVRADDRVDEVVHTDTARKMLSIFRQMEEKASKEDLPDGPKPLKRFTPPPEDKFAKATASESEEEEDDEGEESDAAESGEERDPNYVRASDKVEDEFLKQAQTAARAKTLRAKFEHWETTDDKVTNHNVAEMEIAQGAGDQSSIESASSLRARFESLGSQPSEAPRTTKVKVNRFVEIQTTCAEVCESCEKKVYPLEKVETNNKIFHKQCFRCLQCNCILRMDTFTLNNGKLYCIPHFKQLFITRGNYDEGFGINPHKNKWASSNAASPAMAITSNAPTPIAVSNGDL